MLGFFGLVLGIGALSSCTANFCSAMDTSRILYVLDKGVTIYADEPTITYNSKELQGSKVDLSQFGINTENDIYAFYTFDYSFTKTPEDAGLLSLKKQVIESGKQFRFGNAVEGKSTYDEVASFSDEFIENLKKLDIPTYCIQGISDLIAKPGLINLDFADIRTTMKNKGIAHMGIGHGKGENKTIEAVRQAVSSPLLETTIEGATDIILNVKGGADLSLAEVYEAAELVREVVDPNCNIIFGAGIDEGMNDEVEITIIATGFNSNVINEREEKPQPQPQGLGAQFGRFNQMNQPQPQQPQGQQSGMSRIDVDDNDIPPFLRRIRK